MELAWLVAVGAALVGGMLCFWIWRARQAVSARDPSGGYLIGDQVEGSLAGDHGHHHHDSSTSGGGDSGGSGGSYNRKLWMKRKGDVPFWGCWEDQPQDPGWRRGERYATYAGGYHWTGGS